MQRHYASIIRVLSRGGAGASLSNSGGVRVVAALSATEKVVDRLSRPAAGCTDGQADGHAPRRRAGVTVQRFQSFAWLGVASGLLAVTAACSISLLEVRAREPEVRFPGVAVSNQLEVARCIRGVLERNVSDVVSQEIELGSDGVHVTGQLEESLATAVFYDVAVREDATEARLAPGSVVSAAMLRGAIGACLGAASETGGRQ